MIEKIGGRGGTRTRGPLLAKQVLCQLSYTPTVYGYSGPGHRSGSRTGGYNVTTSLLSSSPSERGNIPLRAVRRDNIAIRSRDNSAKIHGLQSTEQEPLWH